MCFTSLMYKKSKQKQLGLNLDVVFRVFREASEALLTFKPKSFCVRTQAES